MLMLKSSVFLDATQLVASASAAARLINYYEDWLDVMTGTYSRSAPRRHCGDQSHPHDLRTDRSMTAVQRARALSVLLQLHTRLSSTPSRQSVSRIHVMTAAG